MSDDATKAQAHVLISAETHYDASALDPWLDMLMDPEYVTPPMPPPTLKQRLRDWWYGPVMLRLFPDAHEDCD